LLLKQKRKKSPLKVKLIAIGWTLKDKKVACFIYSGHLILKPLKIVSQSQRKEKK
jgi:hypothetical protein